MSFSIHISKEVTSEIDSISKWYGSKDPELKKQFRIEIKRKLSQILTHPEMFKMIGNSQRRAVLGSSFPYSLYYSVDTKNRIIEIRGVLHQHRKLEREYGVNESDRLREIRFRKRRKQSLEDLKFREKRRNKSKDRGLER